MKFLMSIFAVVVLSNQCGPINKDVTNTGQSELYQKVVSIAYVIQSRGVYEKVWVDQHNLYVVDNRDQKNVKSTAILKQDWEELLVLVGNLNLNILPDLKAPSEKRFSDGAPIGSLTIKTDQGEVQSSEFDHGNPPEQLKTILNKLLSIKEKL